MRPTTASDVVVLAAEVRRALHEGQPVVALESAVITHGLPYPQNLKVALEMQAAVAAGGALPATVAVVGGDLRMGVTEQDIKELAESKSNLKIGVRDLAGAAMKRASGGTTVAATMFAANRAGVSVLATGGIGGVHREDMHDVSNDLSALTHTRMIVICAGAKAILDLAATLEVLETLGVPVVGYGTDEFPAFFARESGLRTSARANTIAAVAQYWARHCALGLETAVLVANPIPEPNAISRDELALWLEQASAEAQAQGMRGQGLTPFLLRRIGELSKGTTIEANCALLVNNARLGGEIAAAVARPQ